MLVGRRFSLGSVSLCALLASMLALTSASSVFAGKAHVYGSSFGSSGSGEGQFNQPSGIAVSEVAAAAGDIYVVDRGNSRVEQFSSTGSFIGQFDGTGAPTGTFSFLAAEPENPQTPFIAVDNSSNPLDPSAGDVYVADTGHKVIDKFTVSGTDLGQITQGAGGTPFGEIYGVAVDQEGTVWVFQQRREVDTYSNAEPNVFVASREIEFGTKPGFAVDSHSNLYANRGSRQLAKYNTAGRALVEAFSPEGELTSGVAVDLATNDVYVNTFREEHEKVVATGVARSDEAAACTVEAPCGSPPEGSIIERFGSGHVAEGSGIAVNAGNKTVYVADRAGNEVRVFPQLTLPTVATLEATGLETEHHATLNGTVNPEGLPVEACSFEYGADSGYGHTEECATNPGSGTAPVPVTANLTELAPGAYHYRLVATNSEGTEYGQDQAFISRGLAAIAGFEVTAVGATTATVTAEIAPGGLPTTYELDYGTTAGYGAHTPETDIGAGTSPAKVAVHLTGLAPETVYHVRLSATNTSGSTLSTDLTLVTAAAGTAAAGLSDERAYELVSTATGGGEPYGPAMVGTPNGDITTARLFQAAQDGNAVAYPGSAPAEGGNGDTDNGLGNEWLATRASTGWHTEVLTPAETSFGTMVEDFSPDLTAWDLRWEQEISGLLPPLTPDAPADCRFDLYSHVGGAYRSLITSVKTSGPFGCGQPHFAGASADRSHILFQTQAPLTDDAEEAEGGFEHAVREDWCYLSCNLYDASAGHLELVNVLPGPEQKIAPNATLGGSSEPALLPDFSGAVSADGSRVFWTDTQPGPDIDHIFMRQDDAETVPVSSGAAKYWTASPDGRYALYTEGGVLYRFDAATDERLPLVDASYNARGTGELTAESMEVTAVAPSVGEFHTGEHIFGAGIPPDTTITEVNGSTLTLSAPATTSGTGVALVTGGPAVQGVIGINTAGEDASYIYFVATSVLTEAENASHEQATNGKDNLYLLRAGKPIFIATLATADNNMEQAEPQVQNQAYGDWQAALADRTAEVTPDGHHLLFESVRSLTGYDNVNGNAEVEVFVYSADTEQAACASCAPTGIPPAIGVRNSARSLLATSGQDTHMPRWITDDGTRVFFTSLQPLGRRDTNGIQDVYEWESNGTSKCRLAPGCTSLLSGGESSDFSYFVEADPTGDNVFFTHRGAVAGFGPAGEENELYDARVHGGFPTSQVGCAGTGCQGVPPASPAYATPASNTFTGAGNFPPTPRKTKTAAELRAKKLAKALLLCREKRNRDRRALCERLAKRRYGPPHTANKTSNRQRAK